MVRFSHHTPADLYATLTDGDKLAALTKSKCFINKTIGGGNNEKATHLQGVRGDRHFLMRETQKGYSLTKSKCFINKTIGGGNNGKATYQTTTDKGVRGIDTFS